MKQFKSVFIIILLSIFCSSVVFAKEIKVASADVKAAEKKKKSKKAAKNPDSETIKARPKKRNKETKFYRIEPDIMTNLNYRRRLSYIHARIELMTQGENNVKVLEYHDAAIRDKFILYFNYLKKPNFRAGAPRTKVQQQMLKIVRRLMVQEVGRPVVDGVYLSKIFIE